MRIALLSAALLGAGILTTRAADERIPLLRAGELSFTNVTVTGKSATDLYFMHAGGVGNVKLRLLAPELQQRFGFDAGKAAELERARAEARQQGVNPIYLTPTQRPEVREEPRPGPVPEPKATASPKEPSADSFLGRPGPDIIIDKWLTPAPNRGGRWTFVDYWATWCGPCRATIPHLNALHRKFGDRVVFIGLSNEPEADVRKLKEPVIEYSLAIDTRSQSSRAAGVRSIPHGILMDPKGVVRWEGNPASLAAGELENLLGSR